MSDTTQPSPYLIEFTLSNDGRKRLQQFFDEYFAEKNFELAPLMSINKKFTLYKKTSKEKTEKRLQEILREEIPADDLKKLGEILSGETEAGLVIHNFPEREGLEARLAPKPPFSYAYYIANALYRIHDIAKGDESKSSFSVTRKSMDVSELVALNLHRDVSGEYLALASPYNEITDSCTEVIHLRDAIESIPVEMRPKIKVRTKIMGESENRSVWGEPIGLDEVLQKLYFSPYLMQAQMGELKLDSPTDSEEAKIFTHAIETHNAKVFLKPGDIMFLNQYIMFHRGHEGELSKIKPLPSRFTRVIFNIGGGECREMN